jgi:hypothetical protein
MMNFVLPSTLLRACFVPFVVKNVFWLRLAALGPFWLHKDLPAWKRT